jgi:hypothetical protein
LVQHKMLLKLTDRDRGGYIKTDLRMFLAQDKVAAHTHFGDFEIWKGDPDYMVGKD